MRKLPLKMKILMFSLMVIFMLVYYVLFGAKNAVIGMMIVLIALMNLSNDLYFKPKLSFLKILGLLLIMGVVAFLNSTVTIEGCILTFLVVFGTTFTSYHLFGSNVYMPYLMCYFMMMCIPISPNQLPTRLAALAFGAVFIVGLNLLLNKKKDYKLSKQTIDTLINEINNAIDLKLDGKEVLLENFKVANDFYMTLFSRFEYKYFPNHNHESVLNIVKAFQCIGVVLAEQNLTHEELIHTKNILSDIRDVDVSDIFEGIEVNSPQFSLILLNLEIIVNEIKNNNLEKEEIIPDKSRIKELFLPVIRRHISFKSPKFTFAFKMACVLTLWEILSLMFNLPYAKWLYFASIPMMLPYVNDVAETARYRLGGTIGGILVFAIIFILMPYIPISENALMVLVLFACILAMIYSIEDNLMRTVFTTIMSVMASIMYIPPPEAATLKILWVGVAILVVTVINFGFLPYSVEKETKNNLNISYSLNMNSIQLIKARCECADNINKTSLMVLSNIVRENIEVTDENCELYRIQAQISDISNFILTYFDVHDFSSDAKDKIIRIIDDNESFEGSDMYETVMFDATSYMMQIFTYEKELLFSLFKFQ